MSPQTSAESPAGRSAARSRSIARTRLPRSFWLLAGSHGVNDLYAGSVPAILPFLVTERHYSYAAATGITVAATALSSVVQPLFGHLADRRPLGWLVPLGMLVAGLGVGLSGLVDLYAFTWLAIAISGVGVAAYHPTAAQAARRLSGGSSHVVGLFQLGGSIGSAAAPTLVAIALGAAGVRGTWLLALPAVAMFVVYRLGTRDLHPASSAGPEPTEASANAREQEAPLHRDDWRAFRRLVAVIVCWSIPYVGTVSFVALDAIERFELSNGAGSAALSTFVVAGALGTLAGGWLADRLGRIAVVRGGYALALPAAALLLLAPALPLLFLGSGLLGFALFLPFAAQVTLGQDYLPNRVAMASGVTLGLALSVGGLLAPVFGAIADARGLQTTLAALLAFVALAGAGSLLLHDPRPARRS